jgi:muconate cycloisomerase
VKITRINSYAIEVPIRKELMITSSLGTHDVSRPVLVRLETDSGVEGAGEATVTPAWSGETAWGTKALIDRYLAPVVLGLDVRDTDAALASMDRAVWGNPFAKAAIEMAMLDAWGRAEGKPVYELFGGPVRAARIPIRFSLAAVAPGTTAENARSRVEWGHRTIKVKVGRNAREDVERVRAVREAIGPDLALTVDANGGWSEADAEWALKEMESCNLLLAEQPTAR